MTAGAAVREQAPSNDPRKPIRRSALIAALLALIPGLGHFYVRSRTRGIILLLLLPALTIMTFWRLEVVGVDALAVLRGEQSTASLSSDARTHIGMAIVLTAAAWR